MAEFKKLSEVEQIETASDNATVLIEEGGDIKRVPKSAVGGAGGYVFQLKRAYWDNDAGLYHCDDNYDELYDVLTAGGSVWIDYTDADEAGGGAAPSVYASRTTVWDATNYGAAQSLVTIWNITDVGLAILDIWGMMRGYEFTVYFPNGSHNLEPVEWPDE